MVWYRTKATASFSTDSPKTSAYLVPTQATRQIRISSLRGWVDGSFCNSTEIAQRVTEAIQDKKAGSDHAQK